jgi:hypothetical protein
MSNTQSKPVGEQIDILLDIRTQRLAKAKEVEELKKNETKLTEQIMSSLQELGMTSGKGQLATFSYKPHTVPKLVDFNAIKAYIMETGNLQLFEKRISAPAFRELFELEGGVPGIETYTFDKPSLTRSKK